MTDFKNIHNKLTEQEIRPAELMEGQRVALLTDIGRLLSRRKEFVSVACPACEGTSFIPRMEKRGIDYGECTQCSTIYVNPRPSPDVLQWFYKGSENYAYWNKYVFPASEKARRERIMVPRLNEVVFICSRYGVPMNSVLEVGAGFGTFCMELQSRNVFKRVVAVEPTPPITYMRR